jgi:hypothetical protein
VRIDRSPIFLDLVGGGAWPFLVGGVICLVYSDNERDSGLLTSARVLCSTRFLEGQAVLSCMRKSNNRSVMPLDVRSCTRATLKEAASVLPGSKESGNPVNVLRDWDRHL